MIWQPGDPDSDLWYRLYEWWSEQSDGVYYIRADSLMSADTDWEPVTEWFCAFMPFTPDVDTVGVPSYVMKSRDLDEVQAAAEVHQSLRRG